MRFGLIGCGGIGQLRADALSQTPGLELAALNDLDQARAEALAASHGGIVVGDWRALLDRTDVEAVIVSTPPHLHAEMCIAALQAGKHVLCEKPLARTPEECQAIVDAAERSNRFLATGFNYRFYPSIMKAREIVDAGTIGTVTHVRSYTGYSATDHDHDWLHDAKVMGGGALRDNGIHLIDLTCYFLDDVAEIKGFASNSVWNFDGCEDNGFALLRSGSGQIASLQASWTEWLGYQLRLDIYGTQGCIRTWVFPMLTQVVWGDTLKGDTQKKWHLFPMVQVMEKLKSYRWVVTQSFIKEFEAFHDKVNGKSSQIATATDGLLTIQVAASATTQTRKESGATLI